MRVCSLCQRCYDDEASFCIREGYSPLTEIRPGHCEVVPGYRLEVLLETGIRTQLFRASHLETGHGCLIRIVSARKRIAQSFLRDARLAASLIHPNIVDVYEAGALDDDELFVVSEDPSGESLRDLLEASGTPDLLTTISLMKLAGEALHAVHQSGLVHRSIRPENLVLSTDSDGRQTIRVQQTDFGGVVEQSIVTNKFLIDSAIDSLRYFAPEQCSGGASTVQSDVYSLGIVLYEMLSGKPPFDSPKASGLIEKHRSATPAEVRIDDFELRQLVTHTLTASLQKRPELRQSSANAFARQLRHIEQLATHVSTPPPAAEIPPQVQKVIAAKSVTAAASANTFAASLSDPNGDSGFDVIAATPEIPLRDLPIAQPKATQRSRLKDWRKRLKSKPVPVAETELPDSIEPEHEIPMIDVEPAERELAIAVGSGRNPRKVHWTLPDDDIPSTADVLRELANEPLPAVAATLPEPEMVMAASTASIKVEFQQTAPERFPVFQMEKDEITAVTARSRPIRVTWDRPAAARNVQPARCPQPHASNEVLFFPTIIGGSRQAAVSEPDAAGDIFSSYDSPEGKRFPIPNRIWLAGGAVLAFAVIFLFGSGLVKSYLSNGASTDSVAAEAAPSAVPVPPVIQPVAAPQKRTTPKTVITAQTVSDNKLQTTDGKNKALPPVAKPNDHVQLSTKPDKRTDDRKPAAALNKSVVFTRPRVVSQPRP